MVKEESSEDIISKAVELMENKPEYREILSTILEFEENNKDREDLAFLNRAFGRNYDCRWEWHEVGVQPQRLTHLVQRGILKIVYKSNNSTDYALVDREAVRKAIEYVVDKERRPYPREEEQNQQTVDIPDDLFDPIVGYDDLKEAFRFVLENPDPKLSILMVGPPASSKSVFLYEIERVAGATYMTGGSVTGAGIEDEIIEQTQKGVDIKYILMDEFDGLKSQDYYSIREIQWGGRLKTTKSGKNWDIAVNAPVFAAANSTKRIPGPNLSRFWRGGFHIDPYTESEFHEISTKLLERDGVKPEDAKYITNEVWRTSKDIRDVVRLGDVCKKDRSKLDLWIRLMKKY